MTNLLVDRTDNIWFCKIGQGQVLVNGADHPMRVAVAEAYKRITGKEPDYIFSGWGGQLGEGERAVVENRQPVYEKTDYGQMQILKDQLVEQARELERLKDKWRKRRQGLIDHYESQYNDLLRVAVKFAEQVAKSDQALSFDEEKWAEARSFLAIPAATALQVKHDE